VTGTRCVPSTTVTQPSTPPDQPGPAAPPHLPAQPGYGPAQPGYGPAQPGYGVPAAGYGVPQPGFGAPSHPVWQPTAPNGAPLADFGPRLVAYIIDIAIVTGAIMIVLLPLFFVVVGSMAYAGDEVAVALMPLLFLVYLGLIFAGYWIYLVEMMFRTGQTIGKRVMKIRIVPTVPGATLTRGMAGRRYLVQVVAGFVGSCVFFSYLDGLWQLWDKPYRQCLHDKFADTVVVRVAP
jgi:uncharacterized RDD family membrane protein YckC